MAKFVFFIVKTVNILCPALFQARFHSFFTVSSQFQSAICIICNAVTSYSLKVMQYSSKILPLTILFLPLTVFGFTFHFLFLIL